MKRALTLVTLALVTLSLSAACGGEKGDGVSAADNPFAQRKASIDDYMKTIEAPGDIDKAIAAGQAWLDKNLAAYKANCEVFVEYRKDLKKSRLGKGIETPFRAYRRRLNTVAGFDPKKPDMVKMKKAGELAEQLNSFFSCDNALKAK